MNIKKVMELIGAKKEVVVAGDLEMLETKVNMLTEAKGNKDLGLKTSDVKKLDTRIKWLNAEIDAINTEFEAENAEIKEVASIKNNKGKNNKSKNKGTNKDKVKSDTKPEKAEEQKQSKQEPQVKLKDVAPSKIPTIKPARKFFVVMDTDEELQVIYKDEFVTVLQDDKGVFECPTPEFERNIIRFSVDKREEKYYIIDSYEEY